MDLPLDAYGRESEVLLRYSWAYDHLVRDCMASFGQALVLAEHGVD